MKTKKKWNEVCAGSYITLLEDKTLKGMNGEPRELKKGEYTINGFWADLCGLSFGKKPTSDNLNDVAIWSPELKAFEEIY